MAVSRANAHPTHLPTPSTQASPQHSKRKQSFDTQSYKASLSTTKRQRIESRETEHSAAEEDAAEEDAAEEDAAQEDAAQEDAAQEDAAQEDAAQEDAAQEDVAQEDAAQEDRLSYWVETNTWPQLLQEPSEMPRPSKKRDKSSGHSSSIHWAERYRELAQNGIHDHDRGSLLRDESSNFCRELLQQRFQVVRYASVPHHKFLDILDCVQHLNESRLQRDITPWLVPSPEILRLWGEEGIYGLGEEINAEWSRCKTMGSTHPKPDLTVGLTPSAFSWDENKILRNYASPEYPSYFTANICFPFLTCEAKSSQIGLDVANGQNLHSAAISVRAIFRLYERAYGWRSLKMRDDLDGHTLVFSISHDAHRVALYSHFAVCGDATSTSELQYYRHIIRSLDLEEENGSGHLISYNFVRNVYEGFAPRHLSRIREAVAALAQFSEAFSSGAEDVNSQDQSDAGSSDVNQARKYVRREDSSAATAAMRAQMSQLMERLTQQQEDSAKQLAHSAEQLAQQREDSAKQLAHSAEQLAQQREDSAKQLAHSAEQLAQQREDSAKQLAQQREDSTKQLAQFQQIIDLLRDKHVS
ncbi:MAG: hypothetical protein Q9162_007821 [Coniocarpon cinnabarinum]